MKLITIDLTTRYWVNPLISLLSQNKAVAGLCRPKHITESSYILHVYMQGTIFNTAIYTTYTCQQ